MGHVAWQHALLTKILAVIDFDGQAFQSVLHMPQMCWEICCGTMQ